MAERICSIQKGEIRVIEGSGTPNNKITLGFTPKQLIIYGILGDFNINACFFDFDVENHYCYSTFGESYRLDSTVTYDSISFDNDGFTWTASNLFAQGFYYRAIG